MTFTSSAVRVCQAALQHGVDISGAQFTVFGEPVTAATLAVIHRSGAQASPRYGASECGTIGYGCLAPQLPDEVHLLHDRLALIQPEPSEQIPIGALFVSTVDPTAPLILLNVSLGDRAVVTQRSCGCPLQQYGWATHLHSIRSYEKLTGLGMSFLDSEVVQVLEEVLPEHFGGGPTHYQLVEEIDEEGQPSLRLLVHPSVGSVHPPTLIETFLRAVAEELTEAAYSFSGQRCTAARRFIVHRDIRQRLEEALLGCIQSLRIGLPNDPAVQLGPVISRQKQRSLMQIMSEARSRGARVLCGGDVPVGWDFGCWFEPTLVDVPDSELPVVQNETFGPIAILQQVRDLDDALNLLNGVPQGLVAALYSHDRNIQQRFLQETQCGVLKLNQPTLDADPEAPFGGWKTSGLGPPEHGVWDRDFYTRPQALYGVSCTET